jgi:hypothetical protein
LIVWHEAIKLAVLVTHPGTALHSALLFPAELVELTKAFFLSLLEGHGGQYLFVFLNVGYEGPAKHLKVGSVGSGIFTSIVCEFAELFGHNDLLSGQAGHLDASRKKQGRFWSLPVLFGTATKLECAEFAYL